ncbi:ParB/RepB/Spo0J family partition protein [uncultured Flavonifractor sp.]|uniref:ParB/RepB/Spo0J family partition protein n=1 Tax=uncultured Flavonifractor sp. TaxID=1193534 RepID=UPI00259400E1|nr:ParB/RepB/Spo0J family partition protein [uncultured Flavonifractor sp.]
MGKKTFRFDITEGQEEAPEGSGKLPIDSTGAGRALSNFQDIPVDMLHPCTLKEGEDYSRHNKLLGEQVVESIKQYGILEPLIVRKSPIEQFKYEIIAGESRWEHAKEAGIATVPCRVMELDDNAARNIFHLTNLLRRELTPRDKVHGWYAFYEQLRNQGADDLDAAIAQEQTSVVSIVGGKQLSLRSIQRYVKMHDLIGAWLDKLDAGDITARTGYQIAFLPQNIQEELLAYKVTEQKAAWLHKVYDGGDKKTAWYDAIIQDHLERLDPGGGEEAAPPILTEEEIAERKRAKKLNIRFKKALPGMTAAIRERMRPEDYERADTVIGEALDLYYHKKQQD